MNPGFRKKNLKCKDPEKCLDKNYFSGIAGR